MISSMVKPVFLGGFWGGRGGGNSSFFIDKSLATLLDATAASIFSPTSLGFIVDGGIGTL
jgi:hypothetical protein